MRTMHRIHVHMLICACISSTKCSCSFIAVLASGEQLHWIMQPMHDCPNRCSVDSYVRWNIEPLETEAVDLWAAVVADATASIVIVAVLAVTTVAIIFTVILQTITVEASQMKMEMNKSATLSASTTSIWKTVICMRIQSKRHRLHRMHQLQLNYHLSVSGHWFWTKRVAKYLISIDVCTNGIERSVNGQMNNSIPRNYRFSWFLYACERIVPTKFKILFIRIVFVSWSVCTNIFSENNIFHIDGCMLLISGLKIIPSTWEFDTKKR